METQKNIDAKRIEELETQLAAIQEDARQKEVLIAELKNRPPQVITRPVEVEPPDYKEIKRKNSNLEVQVKKLRQIIEFGGYSELGALIDQYIDSSKNQLKSIMREAELSSYDKSQTREIMELIQYLEDVQNELYSLISTSEQGKWLINPAFRRIKIDADNIGKLLSNTGSISYMEEKHLETLHQILLSSIGTISDFMEKGTKI